VNGVKYSRSPIVGKATLVKHILAKPISLQTIKICRRYENNFSTLCNTRRAIYQVKTILISNGQYISEIE